MLNIAISEDGTRAVADLTDKVTHPAFQAGAATGLDFEQNDD